MKKRLWLKIPALLLALGLLLYAGLVGLVYVWEVTMPEPSEYDSIIVLGAQVLPTGEPSVQLQWRLDKAFEYYQAKPCPVVTCGNMAGTEPRPEGEVMAEVLIAAGADPTLVFSECLSTSTKENIANAWAILQSKGCQKPLIVTSDYHLKRALAIAQDQGIVCEGAGSPCRTEINFWLKNHCREALAWVKYWGLKLLGK